MSQQSDEDTVKFSVALRLARQGEAMSKHTPGPWSIQKRRKGYVGWEVDIDCGFPRRRSIDGDELWPDVTCTVSPCSGLDGQPVGLGVVEANARLIAAAPDLLAFAELVAETFGSSSPIADDARAVIAKAKGE